jgi:hypothetical protein
MLDSRRNATFVFVMCVVCAALAGCAATRRPPARLVLMQHIPGVQCSPTGKVAAKLFRPDRDQIGTRIAALSIDDDGDEVVRWTADTDYRPAAVRVSDSGAVVALDDYFSSGYEHSLVIWSASGERLADYRPEDLLTRDEIRVHVPQRIGLRGGLCWGAPWEFVTSDDIELVNFAGPTDLFVLRFRWGRALVVNLLDGQIWRDFPAPEPYAGQGEWERAMQDYERMLRAS